MSAEAEAQSPPASKYPTHICAACSEIAGTPVGRDWGGFCVGCGMPLPDPEGSAAEVEVAAIGEALRQVPAGRWMALLKMLSFFGAIFALCTGMLLVAPGPALVPGTPLTLANLVWLAVCGPIFLYIAVLCSGFHLGPEGR